jgi:hypothetical protein
LLHDLVRSTDGSSQLAADPRKNLAACAPGNPDEGQFDDSEYRDLLRAGRAGYGYGFSALHLGLADLFGP